MQFGGQPGIAGVDPIAMPLGLVLEQQAQLQWLARAQALGGVGDQLGPYFRKHYGRTSVRGQLALSHTRMAQNDT